jgi:hypothetical protein
MAKFINSYSIFFSGYGYWDMIPLLIRLHHLFYNNEWEMVIHHDRKDIESLNYGKVLNQLHEQKLLKLVYVDRPVFMCKSMLWRMLPIWESNAEYVFCRDADSLLTLRQKICVEQFIESKKSIHGINDNIAHNIPLMGGMFGCKVDAFIEKTKITSLQHLYNLVDYTDEKWSQRGSDQELLNDKIWPHFRNDCLIHNFNTQSDVVISEKYNYDKQVVENDKIFCNYIGACGIKTKIESAINFYSKFVSKDIIEKIEDIEKHYVDDIYMNNLYNQ